MEKVRIHAFVYGRVQGVFFRSHTQAMAEDLRIGGWVRNLPDDRVEVMAEGDKDKIDKLVQFLRKGPFGARVDNVEIKTEDCKNEFKGFRIIY